MSSSSAKVAIYSGSQRWRRRARGSDQHPACSGVSGRHNCEGAAGVLQLASGSPAFAKAPLLSGAPRFVPQTAKTSMLVTLASFGRGQKSGDAEPGSLLHVAGRALLAARHRRAALSSRKHPARPAKSMAEVPPPKRDAAAAASEEPETNEAEDGRHGPQARRRHAVSHHRHLGPDRRRQGGLKQEWCGAAAFASCQGCFATAHPRAGR